MSINIFYMLTDTSQLIYRSTVGRFVDQGVHKIHMIQKL